MADGTTSTGQGALFIIPWLTLPMAIGLRRTLYRSSSAPELNQALAGTARLSLVFSILFALGLMLWRL